MGTLNGRLLELARQLDQIGPAPSLVDLANALESARLTLDDVAAHVETNPKNYHRASVVLREQYELLVMTWLPGQSSVPHDHAGSICAMQVVQGAAVEGSYRVAADGYVDLEYETVVRAGEVTAGQDAGVHTVRNPAASGPPLVTVHIYAPPLRDFRRFVPRPEPTPGALAAVAAAPTVVVIGGGFSGSVLATQLLARATAGSQRLRVAVVERRGAVGEGLAYETRDLAHLLNVPAARMSAWPDRPDDFVQWASRRYGEVQPTQFLPRQWYGEYVRDTLLTTAQQAGSAAELSVIFDEVRRISRHPAGGWMVHLARGSSLRAEMVALAVGHRPPSDPIGSRWQGPRTRFIADPWRPMATSAVGPDDGVVVLGSGLTAVDCVLSLSQQTWRAPITLVSRRGLPPHGHASRPLAPLDMQATVAELTAGPGGVQALPLFRKIRRVARDQVAAGGDWRSVVDGLRPHTARLWQNMSLDQRRRFLSRLRPFWEVHRHRMASAVAERFEALRAAGTVRLVAGRIRAVTGTTDDVRLEISERLTERRIELRPRWVINCTGPAPSNSVTSNPAIGSLLVHGWLQADALELGIETTRGGHAIDVDGREVPDLFLVGTLCKPAFWESTAVPELRSQAATVAEQIMAALGAQQLSSSYDFSHPQTTPAVKSRRAA